jgi:hypothetical protein
MESIRLMSPTWVSGDVLVARSFRDRWWGLRRRADHTSLLLPGVSVHGFGMNRPLTVVALDHSWRVITVRRLSRRGLVVVRDAAWMLEQPLHHPVPEPGQYLSRVGPCPGN